MCNDNFGYVYHASENKYVVSPECKFGDPPIVEICSKKGETEKIQFYLKSKIESTKRMTSCLNRARTLRDLLPGKLSGSSPQKTSKRTSTLYAIWYAVENKW